MADMAELTKEYESGTSGASTKLVRRYEAAQGKLSKAASAEAQASYEEAMKDPNVLKRRQRNLARLTEEDLNKGMREKGGSNYSTGTSAGKDKWAKNAAPFISEAERVSANLPRRTRNVEENIRNRSMPVAKALRALKDKGA